MGVHRIEGSKKMVNVGVRSKHAVKRNSGDEVEIQWQEPDEIMRRVNSMCIKKKTATKKPHEAYLGFEGKYAVGWMRHLNLRDMALAEKTLTLPSSKHANTDWLSHENTAFVIASVESWGTHCQKTTFVAWAAEYRKNVPEHQLQLIQEHSEHWKRLSQLLSSDDL
nr:hypothetical protein Iba_chr06cCG8620 [Ipomoea batatas]